MHYYELDLEAQTYNLGHLQDRSRESNIQELPRQLSEILFNFQ